MSRIVFVALVSICVSAPAFAQVDYRVLATSKTSTMEKEMNEAGAEGYKFAAVMGGETAVGGKEVVVLMQKGGDTTGTFRYKLLATKRTSTMQKEINEAALDGYDYVGQTVFESAFGGEEVVSIVERGAAAESEYVYRLIATQRTSTLQKEVTEAQGEGFRIVGMVSRGEHMVVMERESDSAKR